MRIRSNYMHVYFKLRCLTSACIILKVNDNNATTTHVHNTFFHCTLHFHSNSCDFIQKGCYFVGFYGIFVSSPLSLSVSKVIRLIYFYIILKCHTFYNLRININEYNLCFPFPFLFRFMKNEIIHTILHYRYDQNKNKKNETS